MAAVLLLLATGCAGPQPFKALESPDKRHVAELFRLQPASGSEAMLPYFRLSLRKAGSREEQLLAEGFESLCGVNMGWEGGGVFKLRFPVPYEKYLKTTWQAWDGVTVKRELHEDFVGIKSEAPDGKKRLVQLSNCEHTQWDVYYRQAGNANYNAMMSKGWADPSVLGGFDQRRVLKSITWVDSSHAVLLVQGMRGQVQTRDHVYDVDVIWKFSEEADGPDSVKK